MGASPGSPIPYVLRLQSLKRHGEVFSDSRRKWIPLRQKECLGHGVVSKAEEVPCHRPPQSHHRNGLPRAWGIFIPRGTYGLRSLKATQIEEGGPCILLVSFDQVFTLRGQGREGSISSPDVTSGIHIVSSGLEVKELLCWKASQAFCRN